MKVWGMKTEIIPVVIGALGLGKKGLNKFTNKIPGKINIHEQECTIKKLTSTLECLRIMVYTRFTGCKTNAKKWENNSDNA